MTPSFDAAETARRLQDVGLEAAIDWPLASLTTYGVGGSAACGVRADSDDDARRVAEVLSGAGPLDVLVVGRGSNLLVSDKGFDGVAIMSSRSRAEDEHITIGEGWLEAPGRMPMPVLARRAAAAGCGGLEWAVGIPGSVGGAVRMNAGGHGSDMESSLHSVRLLSLLSARECDVETLNLGLHFRGSALAPSHLVLRARLGYIATDPTRASADIASIVAWRREHQPGGRNAGSVFVNPGEGDASAGALVDACGLRGLRVGGAEVSTKHANFIVASEGATAADIAVLMALVQDAVEEKHGIVLRSEVRLVGFDAETSRRFADPRHLNEAHQLASRRLGALMGESA